MTWGSCWLLSVQFVLCRRVEARIPSKGWEGCKRRQDNVKNGENRSLQMVNVHFDGSAPEPSFNAAFASAAFYDSLLGGDIFSIDADPFYNAPLAKAVG